MLAKIWNFNRWIEETDPAKLKSYFDKVVENAGFHVLDSIEHLFVPYGYTKLYLLAESHFAIHTFPEEGKTYIELSSCNKQMFDRFCEIIGNGH